MCIALTIFLVFSWKCRRVGHLPEDCTVKTNTSTMGNYLHTVGPPVSGHRDQKKCPLKRGVRLWEVKNVVFVCSWEHDQVSAYERCPPTGGVR